MTVFAVALWSCKILSILAKITVFAVLPLFEDFGLEVFQSLEKKNTRKKVKYVKR